MAHTPPRASSAANTAHSAARSHEGLIGCVLAVTDDVLGFLQNWRQWRGVPKRPPVLHHVMLCSQAPLALHIQELAHNHPALAPLAQALAARCFGLIDGFHRLLFEQGKVQLTLCIGKPLATLKQQSFKADIIELDTHILGPAWDDLPRLLAPLCRQGTVVRWIHKPPVNQITQTWISKGFCAIQTNANSDQKTFARFDPPWQIKDRRGPGHGGAAHRRRCMVIGAGLAGAAVAAVMARRGWEVTVLDARAQPADGASGVPVGLLVAHLSKDDCPLSQASRSGVRMTLAQASELLSAGQDWKQTGVFEHNVQGKLQTPPKWSEHGDDWCVLTSEDKANSSEQAKARAVFHRPAGWLKPAALVRAWLSQPGIRVQTSAPVHQVQMEGQRWHALTEDGQSLGEADLMVLANALDAQALVQRLKPAKPDTLENPRRLARMRGMRGLLSSGRQSAVEAASWPAYPINGNGFAMAGIPFDEGLRWFAGASYQDLDQSERSDIENHRHNLEHLHAMAPDLASLVTPAFEEGRIEGWKGVRCTTHDHLPVVGPIDAKQYPGLWACVGLGSRGLSLAVLCAETLAAQIGSEPLPLPVRLVRKLSP